MTSTGKRFVVLDRDGTLIVERNYLSDPEQVELVKNAAAGLRRFRELGFGLLVATNQSGVGRGFFTKETVDRVHARMIQLLAREGVTIDDIYVCPHAPEDDCACRKPKPGLVLQAAADLSFDPAECIYIGDKASDVELGQKLGGAGILVLTGYGQAHYETGRTHPDFVAADLLEAAESVAVRKV